jgi:hypothetical protein
MTSAWIAQDYLADVPMPVHFNSWKHHARALHQLARGSTGSAADFLLHLAQQLRFVGADLMDLYTGPLAPVQIADRVLRELQSRLLLERSAYWSWLQSHGGFQVLTLPEDASRWVLRLGETQERYVHVHPGRWGPETIRVRANALKTAALVAADQALHGGDPFDLQRINRLRKAYLNLAPIPGFRGNQGLRGIIAILAESH